MISIQHIMLYKNHFLETPFQFSILVWISNIQTFNFWISLRKKFNNIHIIQKNRVLETLFQFYILVWILDIQTFKVWIDFRC